MFLFGLNKFKYLISFKSFAYCISIHHNIIQVSHNRSPYPSTIYFSEMDVEQTVKDLQAQNAQFQQMLLALTKGQEELKTLLAKEKKKKAKKLPGIVIMERRFKGQARRTLDFAISSGEGDNQEDRTKEVNNNPASEEEEELDYSEEQYPLDNKYKELEDRLNAMEVQRVPGLDFKEL